MIKHKEPFSTLVETLVQITSSDFTIFFKFAEFAMENSGKCTYLQKIRQIKVSIRLFCWNSVLYGKLGQFKTIREITAGHLY